MTSKETTQMSFLQIKALRLRCRCKAECPLPENTQEPKQSLEHGGFLDTENVSSSLDDNIEGTNEKEKTERQKKDKILSDEHFWGARVPRQAHFHAKHRSTIMHMSPFARNSSLVLSSIPKPKEDDSEQVNKLENGMWMEKKRSISAPGCSYTQARVGKHVFRLPNIPDLQTLSIKANQPINSLVVKGQKLGLANHYENGFAANSKSKDIDGNSRNFPTNKLSTEKANNKRESRKLERCHGDACEDSFPSIKRPAAEYRAKTSYASSSRMFNTYLESRFGKSVYEVIDKKSDTGAGKKIDVYWAPVLIKKKMLYNRTKVAKSTQESRKDVRSTKERKFALEESKHQRKLRRIHEWTPADSIILQREIEETKLRLDS